jgi:CRP-like cAMP-binding protein
MSADPVDVPGTRPTRLGPSPHLDVKLAVITQAPLFRGATRRQWLEIASRSRILYFRRKERIIDQGDPVPDVIVLGSGRLKIVLLGSGGQDVILRLVGPGEVAAGLYSPGCSPVGAEALDSGHALAWERRMLEGLFDLAPVLHHNALRITAERLRSMEERCQELCTERVAVRLARTLLRLFGQIGRRAEGGVVIELSREELALMTGTTLFTVSRLLSQWEAAGMLHSRREAVFIDDPAAIAHEAGEPASEIRGG